MVMDRDDEQNEPHGPSRKKKPRRKPGNSKRSRLEQGFEQIVRATKLLPEPVTQLRFAVGTEFKSETGRDRQWRFDFAWPERKIAVEIDGGIFVGGGHNRGLQFSGDCDKLNAAQELGWLVLRYTTKHLEKCPVQCVEQVARIYAARPEVAVELQRDLF